MDGDEIEEWLLLPSSDISDTEDGNENDEGELEEVTFNQIFSKELERQLVQNHLSLNENMMEEGEEGIIVEEAQIEDDSSQIDTWDEVHRLCLLTHLGFTYDYQFRNIYLLASIRNPAYFGNLM